MKKLIQLCVLCLLSTPLIAKEEHFGLGANMEKLVAIETLLNEPVKYLKSEVTVKGKIVSVCENKGCWMMLASGDKRLRIKVKDGEMVFPISAKDKTAFATGKLETMEMTREKAIAYLSHMAEDSGEDFDASSIEGDITLYQLRPVGVTIK